MRTSITTFVTIFILVALSVAYNYAAIPTTDDNVFLTISTFLFSIFTGFFISRQGARYSDIRKTVATFDGNLSTAYRLAEDISPRLQQKVGVAVENHYERILSENAWDYHFTHKSTTLTDINRALREEVGDAKLESLKNQALGGIIKSISGAQEMRKHMVALREERIPHFQWFLIYFFMTMLFLAVSTIPSQDMILPSLLKAAFVTSIISVVVILNRLDSLRMFEGIIGEHSARDVVGIIKGHK